MAGMHQPSDFQVFRTLDRTSNARLLRSSTLSDGLALAHWYRDEAEILGYSDPGHHTLSLYLQGGWQTFRRDRPGLYGGPDRFCVMPAEHHCRAAGRPSAAIVPGSMAAPTASA